MKTKRFTKADIQLVADDLINGKIIAFPTDTVFGLAAIYENEAALHALQKAKGRPDNKPIPTMVANVEQMEKIAHLDQKGKQLVKAFMPGAFTIILKKQESLPSYLTNGFDTIGIRMPNDPFILALIALCKKPLLVTSANRSGEETGINADQVLQQLEGRIDGIVLGEANGQIASTILDYSRSKPEIIRKGPIDVEQIYTVFHS